MRILSLNSGLITNYEVNQVLMQQKARNKQSGTGTKDMKFIESQVGHYLYTHSLVKRQTEESIKAFLEASKRFNLSHAENMQIINICPTTLVEVFLAIDNCDGRYGKDGAEALLELIMSTLYVDVPQEKPKTVTVEAIKLKERQSKPSQGKKGQRGRAGSRKGRAAPSSSSTATASSSTAKN